MDTWLKINSSVIGKDRLIRLLQYFSKLLWYALERAKWNATIVAKIKNLEYHFGTFRKLLRFGKFVEAINGALVTLNSSDVVYRTLLTLSKISQAVFLLADHVLWIGRAGLFDVKKTWWSSLSTRCWLYSIVLNLLRDCYELRLLSSFLKPQQSSLAKKSDHTAFQGKFKPVLRTVAFVKLITRNRPDVAADLMKNVCDFFIPMTSEGYMRLSPGVIGALGSISSIIGILTVVNNSWKLSPS